jgi:hypothetical protein
LDPLITVALALFEESTEMVAKSSACTVTFSTTVLTLRIRSRLTSCSRTIADSGLFISNPENFASTWYLPSGTFFSR